MILGWLKATEGNSISVRVLLFDYRKAFDLIDYKVLVNKLKQVNTPNIVGLLTLFQEDLKGSNSERTSFYSGAGCRSKRAKMGPWLFLLVINDLYVSTYFKGS